jgi:hypothetical protein
MQLRLRRGSAVWQVALCAIAIAMFAAVTSNAAAAPSAHGQFPHLVKPRLSVNTNQSNNWFGYNQGALEQGGTLFHAITGDWTVPTASAHTKGQDAYSSTWIGIGGGCLDATCTTTDNTLIQTGTEQDVDTSGHASYSSWWEIIPGPSLTISNMTVGAGDHMHADIHETVANSEVWQITLTDVTRNESFTTTVPYPSTHGTAEWIQETPLLLGTNAGFSALPNLTTTAFDLGTANGAAAALKPSEQMQLVDGSGRVIGSPSAPDSDSDGFGLCSWATSCSTPGS